MATIKDTTIPQLENEKAIAVKNKNFKGAKAAQDELKKFQGQLEENEKTKASTVSALDNVKKVTFHSSVLRLELILMT